MFYIHFFGNNGYCGTDYDEYVAFDDHVTTDEINDYSYELAMQNAESFAYVHTGWGEDFEDDNDMEFYFQQAFDYCSWEEISEGEYWDHIND